MWVERGKFKSGENSVKVDPVFPAGGRPKAALREPGPKNSPTEGFRSGGHVIVIPAGVAYPFGTGELVVPGSEPGVEKAAAGRLIRVGDSEPLF